MMPFTDEEIYEAVKNNLDKVSSYVSSHGGGITLLGSKRVKSVNPSRWYLCRRFKKRSKLY